MLLKMSHQPPELLCLAHCLLWRRPTPRSLASGHWLVTACHWCPGPGFRLSSVLAGAFRRCLDWLLLPLTNVAGSVAAVRHRLCHSCVSHLSVTGSVAGVCHRLCQRAAGCGGRMSLHISQPKPAGWGTNNQTSKLTNKQTN